MKIIGFSQLRNELSKGNLENWFKSMGMCEYVYIFDQASDDGSHDVYEQHDNVVLIQSEENLFRQEILCKKQLLEKLLLEHPDTDWIFWMDGDTVLDQRLLNNDYAMLEEVLDASAESGADERSIMAMTGHKTTLMVRRYIKEANIFKNNALNKVKI